MWRFARNRATGLSAVFAPPTCWLPPTYSTATSRSITYAVKEITTTNAKTHAKQFKPYDCYREFCRGFDRTLWTSTSRSCDDDLQSTQEAGGGRRPLEAPVTKTELNQLKVDQLRAELQQRGQHVDGALKPELVNRLLETINSSDSSGSPPPAPAKPPSNNPSVASSKDLRTLALDKGFRRQERSGTGLSTQQLRNLRQQLKEELREQLTQELETEMAAERERMRGGEGASRAEEEERAGRNAGLLSFPWVKHRGFDGGRNVHALDVWNPTGMELVFLGTSAGSPTTRRNVSSVVLRLEWRDWLFDCGEGTVRQMLRCPLQAGRIDRIFVTHLHGDHVNGLPGMLASINFARQAGAEGARGEVHVHGPPGLAALLAPPLSHLGLALRVVVHELATGRPRGAREGRPEDGPWEERVARGIFRRLVYPTGGAATHGTTADGGRAWERGTKKVRGTREEGLWEVCSVTYHGCEYTVTAAHLEHKVECFGYVVKEAERAGRLDVRKATELGVPPGRAYSDLKEGRPVTAKDGTTVNPEQVIGPPLPGRKVCILGDTSDSSLIAGAAYGADVLVHEATFPAAMSRHARATGHSSSHMAGSYAREVNAEQLILTHFSARFDGYKRDGGDEGSFSGTTQLDSFVREAQDAFHGPNVVAAYDFYRYRVKRREADGTKIDYCSSSAAQSRLAAQKQDIERKNGKGTRSIKRKWNRKRAIAQHRY